MSQRQSSYQLAIHNVPDLSKGRQIAQEEVGHSVAGVIRAGVRKAEDSLRVTSAKIYGVVEPGPPKVSSELQGVFPPHPNRVVPESRARTPPNLCHSRVLTKCRAPTPH